MITLSLPEIVQKFLDDHSYIEGQMPLVSERERTISIIQPALHEFLQGTITLIQLKDVINQMKRPWYSGKGISHAIIEIDTFVKNHLKSNKEAEEHLRTILQDLNTHTVGQTIERCYTFLMQERDRLQHTGLSTSAIVKPASSAYIIPLLALWLDSEGDIIICTLSGRNTINWLVREGVIPGDPDLKLSGSGVIIQTLRTIRSVFVAL